MLKCWLRTWMLKTVVWRAPQCRLADIIQRGTKFTWWRRHVTSPFSNSGMAQLLRRVSWTGPTLHLHDQELKKKSDDCTLRDICIESDTPKSVQGSLSDQKYLCSISNRFWLLRDDPRRGDISSPWWYIASTNQKSLRCCFSLSGRRIGGNLSGLLTSTFNIASALSHLSPHRDQRDASVQRQLSL